MYIRKVAIESAVIFIIRPLSDLAIPSVVDLTHKEVGKNIFDMVIAYNKF